MRQKTINFAGQRDCETDVLIREGNNVVGHARNHTMRPGVNELEVPATENFRFRGRELCLNVQVDLDGSRQQIDADRRFCARQRTMWSMSEREKRWLLSTKCSRLSRSATPPCSVRQSLFS